jgi:hypothetical protein
MRETKAGFSMNGQIQSGYDKRKYASSGDRLSMASSTHFWLRFSV